MKSNLSPSAGIRRIRSASIFFIIIFVLAAVNAHAQSAWNVPKEYQNIKNPVPMDVATLKDAKVLYTNNCVPCHGPKGRGDGIAAAGLTPKPADHSSDKVQQETDGSLFWKISEGHNPMPEYKTVLTETQRWELVNYIRSLAKKQKN